MQHFAQEQSTGTAGGSAPAQVDGDEGGRAKQDAAVEERGDGVSSAGSRGGAEEGTRGRRRASKKKEAWVSVGPAEKPNE